MATQKKKIHKDSNGENKISINNKDVDLSNKNNLNDNSTIIKIKTNINCSEEGSKKNMINKDIENNKNKNGVKDGNLLEKLILRIDRLELDVIKSKFQIIDIELKLIKTQEWIINENIINSE